MTEPARNYQTSHATTEGLDDFFEAAESTVQDTVQDEITSVQDTVQREMTVLEAAELLNIDRRSVVRLLNWKKLSGRKDARGRWSIDRTSVLERSALQDTVPNDVQDIVSQNDCDVLDVSASPSPDVQDSVLQVSTEQPGVWEPATNQSATLIRELQTKLEGASFRIGYLEAQLEAERHQVKLLMDSQHNRGAWSRFWTWFIGK